MRENKTAAIRAAVFQELAATGYARMTMEGIARRSGVGKAAIYRRWPSKQAMVVDLVAQIAVDVAEVESTGTLRGDVRRLLERTREALRSPIVAGIVADLAGEVTRETSLGSAMREAVTIPRREATARWLRTAVQRGELRETLDIELALDLLVGPLFVRLLVTRASGPPEWLDQLTDMTVAALLSA